MRRGKPTKLGVVFLVIISAAILISGLLWVAQTIFGGSSNKTATVSAGQKLLNDPTDSTSVRMSVRGPIVAKEDHYSIVITISQTERQIVTYRGYDGEVIETKTIGNTQSAFKELMAALKRASYMTENSGADSQNEGVCADGQLIQFEIIDNGKTAEKLWTTSCSKVTGSFGGLVSNVEDLFLNQISDSRQIIQNAKDAVE